MDLAGGCGERRVQSQGQLLRMQTAGGSFFQLPASPYSLLFTFCIKLKVNGLDPPLSSHTGLLGHHLPPSEAYTKLEKSGVHSLMATLRCCQSSKQFLRSCSHGFRVWGWFRALKNMVGNVLSRGDGME